MSLFWRIRVLLFYLTATIWSACFLLAMIIPSKLSFLSHAAKYKMAEIYSKVFLLFTKLICGIKYNVTGLDKLPSTPAVVMANHQSFLDNVFMQEVIPPHSWIIKRELYKIPFFGWGLRLMRPVAVNRSAGISVKQILREGKKKIDSGLWMIIFPESTRIRPGAHKKFKPSGISLAAHAGAPVVMMAHNAGIFWPKDFWISRSGNIEIKIIGVLSADKIREMGVRAATDHIEAIINKEKDALSKPYIDS